ncbi:recombinase family protein [Aliiglaciecola lipolytica]|uniref:recombinase family protein n=1 Tax=Aliiglaciecola lipolytica TaxID=477689 RepID=UPI001C096D34|nr:recombinase family protein [Aliiglaciecola lipolytica]MBU2877057.1 recombinase family protein [Aliiglaciecola lipolytica]
MKTVIYARYSTDLQSAASIEDQYRECEAYAKRHNFKITSFFSDKAASGSSMNRGGLASLMENMHQFDAVLCESLDRLSRDQGDIANIRKRLAFSNVKIFTIEDGEIGSMHIGLKGTMNAMQLDVIRDKTKRGLRGKVENGKSAGGKSYGYNPVREFDCAGNLIKGELEINDDESKVIRKIFEDYAYNDKSAKTIAKELNAKGISAPNGADWGCSTINGNKKRGTGILNNELYIGVRIWNRLRYVKHPETGRRVSRLNDESDWVMKNVPNLRIVSQELWKAVKSKQNLVSSPNGVKKPKMRAKYLFSDLFKCNVCGGGASMSNSISYGCSTARNKGTCDNKKLVKRITVESAALSAIKSELLKTDVVDVVIQEYNKSMRELVRDSQKSSINTKSVVAKLEAEKVNLINSIKAGIDPKLVADSLAEVSVRLEEAKLKQVAPSLKEVNNNGIADKFRRYIDELTTDDLSNEAKIAIRSLVEKLELKANGDVDLVLNPFGLAKKRPAINSESIRMVAGAGFEPTTFGL